MAHFIAGDDKHPDLSYNEDYRLHLFGRREAPSIYRFGSARGKRVRAALSRVHGYFRTTIEAIANAKLRRMQRELELRGIHYDRASESWLVHKSDPAEHSR